MSQPLSDSNNYLWNKPNENESDSGSTSYQLMNLPWSTNNTWDPPISDSSSSNVTNSMSISGNTTVPSVESSSFFSNLWAAPTTLGNSDRENESSSSSSTLWSSNAAVSTASSSTTVVPSNTDQQYSTNSLLSNAWESRSSTNHSSWAATSSNTAAGGTTGSTTSNEAPIGSSRDSNSTAQNNSKDSTVSGSSTTTTTTTATISVDDERMLALINKLDGWNSEFVDQKTAWKLDGEIQEEQNIRNKASIESNVWTNEPPDGTGLWEKHYEKLGERTARWNSTPTSIVQSPTTASLAASVAASSLLWDNNATQNINNASSSTDQRGDNNNWSSSTASSNTTNTRVTNQWKDANDNPNNTIISSTSSTPWSTSSSRGIESIDTTKIKSTGTFLTSSNVDNMSHPKDMQIRNSQHISKPKEFVYPNQDATVPTMLDLHSPERNNPRLSDNNSGFLSNRMNHQANKQNDSAFTGDTFNLNSGQRPVPSLPPTESLQQLLRTQEIIGAEIQTNRQRIRELNSLQINNLNPMEKQEVQIRLQQFQIRYQKAIELFANIQQKISAFHTSLSPMNQPPQSLPPQQQQQQQQHPVMLMSSRQQQQQQQQSLNGQTMSVMASTNHRFGNTNSQQQIHPDVLTQFNDMKLSTQDNMNDFISPLPHSHSSNQSNNWKEDYFFSYKNDSYDNIGGGIGRGNAPGVGNNNPTAQQKLSNRRWPSDKSAFNEPYGVGNNNNNTGNNIPMQSNGYHHSHPHHHPQAQPPPSQLSSSNSPFWILLRNLPSHISPESLRSHIQSFINPDQFHPNVIAHWILIAFSNYDDMRRAVGFLQQILPSNCSIDQLSPNEAATKFAELRNLAHRFSANSTMGNPLSSSGNIGNNTSNNLWPNTAAVVGGGSGKTAPGNPTPGGGAAGGGIVDPTTVAAAAYHDLYNNHLYGMGSPPGISSTGLPNLTQPPPPLSGMDAASMLLMRKGPNGAGNPSLSHF